MSNISYAQDDLNTSLNKLKVIDNWNIYIDIIDKFLINNISNYDKLLSIKDKIVKVRWQIQWQTEIIYNNFNLILNYLEFSIDNIINKKEDIIDNNINEEIIDEEENNYIEEIIYPWFSNKYNDNNKTILAWTEEYIYAWWVWSFYEDAEVNEIILYITWNNINNLKSSIKQSKIYYKWLLVSTAWYSNIDVINSTKLSITFDDIDNFILSKDYINDYRFSIITNNIWYEKVWKTSKNLIIVDIKFTDVIWLTSDTQISNISIENFETEYFSIVPNLLEVSVEKNLNTSSLIELKLLNNYWNNTIESSKSFPKIILDKLELNVFWNQEEVADYILYNKNDSFDYIQWVYHWWKVEFDISSLNYWNKAIWNIENYIIRITWIDSFLTIELPKNWIIYDIDWVSDSNDININLQNNIDLWIRDF